MSGQLVPYVISNRFVSLTASITIAFVIVMSLFGSVTAQDLELRTVQPRVLLAMSLIGQEIGKRSDAARLELRKKNEMSIAALESEEEELAQKKPQLSQEEFQVFAKAFDRKAIANREEAALEERYIVATEQAWYSRFIELSRRVIAVWSNQNGAKIVINRDSALWADPSFDVTQEIVKLLDMEYQKDKDAWNEFIFAPIETIGDEVSETTELNEEEVN